MLPIPSSLLNKLKSLKLTPGYNTDPQMDIIAQKAAKYLNQGSFLNARTVRTGNSLGPLDVCLRRENKNQEPTEIVMLYIEDGYAKVATLPYVHMPDQNFVYQYTVGAASDVACDFDGRFELVTDRTGIYFDSEVIWSLVTFGDPYLVLINNGVLIIQIGQGAPFTLVAADAVKCSILRGWKSITNILVDEGLICAYTKTDGKVYYRAYCEQEDGSFIWELEHEITEFVGTTTNLGIFRCADYRTGFLAEISGQIQMLLTARAWSGMANLPEYISVTNIEATTALIPIIYYDCSNTENISINVSVIGYPEPMLMATYSPTLLEAHNIAISMEDPETTGSYYDDYGYRVVFKFDQHIPNAADYPSHFKLVDAYNTTWFGQSAVVDHNEVTVTFTDFNNAENSITATALSGNLWNGYAMLTETSKVFDATGLVPTVIPVPVIVSITNTDAKTIIMTFDRPIISIGSQSGIVTTALEPNMSPEGILSTKTYGFASAAIVEADPTQVQINLTNVGRLKFPQGDVTVTFTGSMTGQGGAMVAPFIQSFTPTSLVPVFNPHDPENISISIVATTNLIQLYYEYYRSDHENVSVSVSATGNLYHIDDIPV